MLRPAESRAASDSAAAAFKFGKATGGQKILSFSRQDEDKNFFLPNVAE